MHDNIVLHTDSYKTSHWLSYEQGTTGVYSYFESRGGDFPETVFFGLSYIMQRYLARRVTQADVEDAAEIYKLHFGTDKLFNRAGWEHIVRDHGGRLPVRIKAVPEGTAVPNHNVLLTVENTCPKDFWLTNWLETLLSQVWYPSTVATQSREGKRIILGWLERTGDPALADFKLHDFGFRGVSSTESAGIGGAAHLVNFRGTDTVAALLLARDYYHEAMAGFSIPAAEHSTITSWGREREVDAFRNMVRQFGTGAPGLYAVVSDSFDIFAACEHLWGETLKAEVLAAENGLVIRPDSGDPPTVVVRVLDILGAKFGYTRNAKGYKLLHPKVRVIQGDGVDLKMIDKVLGAMAKAGWSADNIAFGMGGALLQRLNRDNLKFAFKCSAVTVNGEERDVYKQPVTDPGKNSKRGRLVLVRDAGGYRTMRAEEAKAAGLSDELRTVFEDGEVITTPSLAEVRARAALPESAYKAAAVAAP